MTHCVKPSWHDTPTVSNDADGNHAHERRRLPSSVAARLLPTPNRESIQPKPAALDEICSRLLEPGPASTFDSDVERLFVRRRRRARACKKTPMSRAHLHLLTTPTRLPRRAVISKLHPKLDWDNDGHDWPNRRSSAFVHAGGLRWHVQQMGDGPVLLLVHGTSAATHSWRALAPLLAEHFTIVAPDLPGHGFTETPEAMALEAMADGLAALLRGIGHRPVLAAGHSAGAAVLARMCLDGAIDPAGLVSLNGALLPIGGRTGRMMMPLARLLAARAFVPRMMARFARNKGLIERMIADTGSTIDDDGVEMYRRVVSSPGHVAAALQMMASWELERLAAELPKLKPHLLLIAGSNDKTIAYHDAARVHSAVPNSQLVLMPGLGHLAHEERPHEVAGLMIELSRGLGLLRPMLAAAE
jgi:magnesium chelatase accessory protein